MPQDGIKGEAGWLAGVSKGVNLKGLEDKWPVFLCECVLDGWLPGCRSAATVVSIGKYVGQEASFIATNFWA